MEEEFEILIENEGLLDIEMIHDEENFDIKIANDTIVTTNKDYNKLINKPLINNVTLEGNKTLEELEIPNSRVTNLEIDSLF